MNIPEFKNGSPYVGKPPNESATGWSTPARVLGTILALVVSATPAMAQQIVSASAGFNYTMFITADGGAYGVGANTGGQLCDGKIWGVGIPDPGEVPYPSTTDKSRPIRVATGFSRVRAGVTTTAFLTGDGDLWIGGSNAFGQLADGTSSGTGTVRIFVPRRVATSVADVDLGSHHTVYLKLDNTLWGAGVNSYGQLGDGTTTQRWTPVRMGVDVIALAAGTAHTVFVKSDGSLWATGWNENGQLGNGTRANRGTPVQVASDVASVSAGVAFTMFVKKDGSLWGAGQNVSGQLGDGSTTDRLVPVQVATGVVSVVTGDHFTLFLKANGTMWGMGNGAISALGPSAVAKQVTPIQIATNVLWVTAGGNGNTVYKTNAGQVWTMGSNVFGQLADGTKVNKSTPVRIEGSDQTITFEPLINRTVFDPPFTLTATASSGLPITYSVTGPGVLVNGNTLSLTGFSGVVAVTAQQSGNAAFFVANPVSQRFGVTLSEPVAVAPGIATQPSSQTVLVGGNVTLSVSASGSPAPAYQWYRNGTPISGATNSTLMLSNLPATASGPYSVVVTNSAGSVTSAVATVTVVSPGNAAIISNVSVRTTLAPTQTLIVGITMNGGSKSVLLRAVGPGLTPFGVTGAMADPKLAVFRNSIQIDTNDNWGGTPVLSAAFASVGAFALTPNSLDAALIRTIEGGHTAQVSGTVGGSVLVEAYDAGSGDTPRLVNVSARNRVGTGSDILIAGFTISGNSSKTVLIRAVGPALAVFGVPGVLVDPKLEVYSGATKINENDTWSAALADTFTRVGAFALSAGSKDAALVVTLSPGSYTVLVSGADGGTGEALVEIYEVSP